MKLYSCSCSLCGGRIVVGTDEKSLICKGCGEKVIDVSMCSLVEYQRSVICPNCGAKMRNNSTGELLICDYCDGVFLLDALKKNSSGKYDFIVPFDDESYSNTREMFFRACELEFAPNDFRENAKIKKISNIYLPVYTYSVTSNIHYSIEIGKDIKVPDGGRYKTETIWKETSGNFTKDFIVNLKGFKADDVLDDTATKSNIKEIEKFGDLLVSEKGSFPKSDRYSPLLLKGHDACCSLSSTSAWENKGEEKVKEKAKNAVREMYKNNKKRNLQIIANNKLNRYQSTLLPASLVSYEYGKVTDGLVILDGVNGNLYRGNIPVSSKKIAVKLLQWLLPAIIFVFGFTFFKINSDMPSAWFMVLSVVLAVLIWFWIRKIKGTAHGENADARQLNNARNKKFGMASSTVAIVMCLLLGVSSADSNKQDNFDTTKEVFTAYAGQDENERFAVDPDDLTENTYGTKIQEMTIQDMESMRASNILELLKLKRLEIDVSDTTDVSFAKTMITDYFAHIAENKTVYFLGKCESAEGSDIINGGYAFVTEIPSADDYERWYFYAKPMYSSLLVCYVDSEIDLVWKNNLPENITGAEMLAKQVLGKEAVFIGTVTDGYYEFRYNDNCFYVTWDCNSIFVDRADGKKTQIYPEDTIGYFNDRTQ